MRQLLDAERDSITTLDYPWLTKTTERILRLAGSAPSNDALDLALHCESLFALASAREIDPRRSVVPVVSAVIDQAPDAVFVPPSRLALQSIVPSDDAGVSRAERAPVPPDTAAMAPAPPLRWSRSRQKSDVQATLPRPFEIGQNPDLKVATPIPVTDDSIPQENVPDLWEKIDSRSLFQRWLSTSGEPKLQIERELHRREFGVLRPDVVRLALSDDTEGRVQLVEDLLSTPGVGASAWLTMLAEDHDAEVRLAAVTIMATSQDHQLLEKAWQVALHDQDPRIASLAQRLRDRHMAPNTLR